MMGIALGGIGVLSLRVPYTLSHSFVHLLDLPSILLATFIVAVFGLIAYFTNPNEASFRAFLTELAFRKHLSRLNEAQDTDSEDEDDTRSHSTCSLDHKNAKQHGTGHGHTPASITEAPIVFHFANKASVSLRTPGYHFRSFGILTFAIVSPVEMAATPVAVPNPAHGPVQPPKSMSWNNPSTRGAWFIGAYGKWWLGVEMNMHPRQVKLATQDDVALHDKELAHPQGDDGESGGATRVVEEVTLPPKAVKPIIPRRSSAAASSRTKAALRERLSLQTASSHKRDAQPHAQIPSRPTTPPPLPKSASLPLHAKRIPPPSPETCRVKSETGVHHSPPLLPTTLIPETSVPTRPRTPSIHDHSPVIADILKQLDATRSATSDLQTQLAECRDASARTQLSLQTEVDAARATKKRDDVTRAEIKARTKLLEDARRQADGSKREAEKKLKAASAARDGATERIERLEREIGAMQRQMTEHSERAVESQAQADAERNEISEALTLKREEIKIAEDVVSALASRTRELEGNIAEEEERLRKMKESAVARRQQHAAVSASQADISLWPPALSNSGRTLPRGLLSRHQLAPTPGTDAARQSPDTRRTSSSPRPRPPPLAGISTLSAGMTPMKDNGNAAVVDDQYVPSQFRPFSDSPVSHPTALPYTGPLSPVSASLIPNSLIHSIEHPRSTMPNSDPLFGRIPMTSSPISDELHSSADEPFPASHILRSDSQRAVMPPPAQSPLHENELAAEKPRGWFPTAVAKEKGLNPDAKVFTLPHRRPFALSPTSSASTLNALGSDPSYPNYATDSPTPRLGVTGSLFTRSAFAPSPAEREALQRGMSPGSVSSEHVSSHGAGGSSVGESGGGSQHSSPHWVDESWRDVRLATQKSSYNPWAGAEVKI